MDGTRDRFAAAWSHRCAGWTRRIEDARRQSGEEQRAVYKPITTIVLAARNTAELDHIAWSLANITAEVEMFWDENSAAYGDGIKPCTAICTHPIEKDKIELAISHLPLWSPKVAA